MNSFIRVAFAHDMYLGQTKWEKQEEREERMREHKIWCKQLRRREEQHEINTILQSYIKLLHFVPKD